MYLSSRFMQRADSGSRPRLQALLDSATLWLKDQVGCEVCVCVCVHMYRLLPKTNKRLSKVIEKSKSIFVALLVLILNHSFMQFSSEEHVRSYEWKANMQNIAKTFLELLFYKAAVFIIGYLNTQGYTKIFQKVCGHTQFSKKSISRPSTSICVLSKNQLAGEHM